MFCTSCGQEIPEGKSFCSNCGAPIGKSSKTTTGSGLPRGPKRTGLIVGSVVAAVIVLAGIGVGLWLGLRGDGEATGAASTGTTTTTSVDDGFSPAAPADDYVEGPGVMPTTGDALTDYYAAVNYLLGEMDYYHARIPVLADIINDNVPDTPEPVYRELEAMTNQIVTVLEGLDLLPVPEGYETADYWFREAATHMNNRILATMSGIEAMWDSGSVNSGLPFFATGRTERDAYEDAIGAYYGCFGGT
jgi:hypothetical protein